MMTSWYQYFAGRLSFGGVKAAGGVCRRRPWRNGEARINVTSFSRLCARGEAAERHVSCWRL